jgi:UDP-galactopyranose mutase
LALTKQTKSLIAISLAMAAKFLVVGAGFSGCVIANQLVQLLDCTVDIVDERPHLGGNCHTDRDEETGVMVHHYGPHIFNTDKKYIWDFVNQFGELRPYVHRVKAQTKTGIFPLPINLQTINLFFNKQFTPAEAINFVASLGDNNIEHPKNFEEQALKFIGKELYEAFFYGYTKKQWGCEPAELPAAILKRLPVRFNYDDNYHNNLYTGIPADGYTAIMQKMIAHPAIRLALQTPFEPTGSYSEYQHVFYTGALDAYFGWCFGRLGYRTVNFEKHISQGDYQGTTQINYCHEDVPYTRITEHSHFTPWEQHQKTVYFVEYSKETTAADTPFYPKRLQADKAMLLQYRELACQQKRVSFLGRLATYRYMDMHHVIGEALQYAQTFAKAYANGEQPAVFPNVE